MAGGYYRDGNKSILLAYIDAYLDRQYISVGHYRALVWIREQILKGMKREGVL